MQVVERDVAYHLASGAEGLLRVLIMNKKFKDPVVLEKK